MEPLYMVELQLDIPALLRFLASQGLDRSGEDDDLGYGVHAWMAAAFGELAPHPWRLFTGRGRPARVLGYTSHDAAELRQRLREFADPSVWAVCAQPDAAIASREMPSDWRTGRRLAFEVLGCPVGRKAGTRVEKDLFLIRADEPQAQRLRRDAVYCEWAREQLERHAAARVTFIRLEGFRLVRQIRKDQGTGGQRSLRRLVRPQALLRGELTVGDPEAFSALLRRGVGRHRAFGYGMLLLRPAP